jgi:hypothetical protein
VTNRHDTCISSTSSAAIYPARPEEIMGQMVTDVRCCREKISFQYMSALNLIPSSGNFRQIHRLIDNGVTGCLESMGTLENEAECTRTRMCAIFRNFGFVCRPTNGIFTLFLMISFDFS